jgi:hypothetical protein
MSKVKEFNKWVKMMCELPEEKRQEWVNRIFEGLESQAAKENPKTSKELSYLTDILKDGRKFNLIGFSTNASYIKDKKRKNDPGVLNSIYVHAWGSPKLLFEHKKLPILIIIGPDLRVDESVLDEGSNRYKNKRYDVTGITG